MIIDVYAPLSLAGIKARMAILIVFSPIFLPAMVVAPIEAIEHIMVLHKLHKTLVEITGGVEPIAWLHSMVYDGTKVLQSLAVIAVGDSKWQDFLKKYSQNIDDAEVIKYFEELAQIYNVQGGLVDSISCEVGECSILLGVGHEEVNLR